MSEYKSQDGSEMQGASRLLNKIDNAVRRFEEDPVIISDMEFPTITTQTGRFPPVLFLSRLIEGTGYSSSFGEIPQRLLCANNILKILNDLKAGSIDFTRNTFKNITHRGPVNSFV